METEVSAVSRCGVTAVESRLRTNDIGRSIWYLGSTGEKGQWFGEVGANPDYLKGTFARLFRLRADIQFNATKGI
jgi:hypothetical protein